MKIGLSTGGGDCPGLNSVIRAVVRYAVGKLGHEVIGIEDSFLGLMEKPYRVRSLGLKDVSGILNRGGTILGTTNAGNPFKIKSGTPPEMCDKSTILLQAYQELELDCIIVIGGDGTQTIAYQLSQIGVNVIGIPKTIDNDLVNADITVGFETAVEVASDAILRLQSTAESHARIMVLEVMGRHAGHIALHSGTASGAHVILLPEIPFAYDAIISKIHERQRQGMNYSVVVAAEGAMEEGNEPLFKSSRSGQRQLGGIGQLVAETLSQLTSIDTRITVLGHIQRGGQPCPRDRVLGTLYGVKAVELANRNEYGKLIVMHNNRMETVSYNTVANSFRPISQDDMYLLAAEAIGICLGR
ncbi:MAG: ATP-dependent 6-phosphofructokinase [Proteobacteria bacterium]|nr:ATP-dependent 6-phosphofructokinase [Pseudomonadota bacterium]